MTMAPRCENSRDRDTGGYPMRLNLTRHRTNRNPVDRFWAKVAKSDKCWVWTGSKNELDYGQIRIEGQSVRVSRYSWFLHYGEMPSENLHVCHHCDNPACVRPDHLFLGSRSDNMKDMANKGRHAYPLTMTLSESDIYAIRRAYDAGEKSYHIAKRYPQVRGHAVNKICRRVAWKHIPEEGADAA